MVQLPPPKSQKNLFHVTLTKNPRTKVRGFLLFHYYLFTLHSSLIYEDFWKVISNSE